MIIRRQPQDFIVKETLRDGVVSTDAGPLKLYRVTKTSLTTIEAAARFAKLLGLKSGAVSYAGLKDKHAVTEQHMAVAPSEAPLPDNVLNTGGMMAEPIGYVHAPLTSRDISHNSFEIVIRGCTPADINKLRQRGGALLSAAGDLPVINYFGEQRFGSARHGAGFIAKALIAGDFETALRLAIGTPARKDSGSRRGLTRAAAANWGNWPVAVKEAPPGPGRAPLEVLKAGGNFRDAFAQIAYVEQELFVDAYQSYLWNQIVSAWCDCVEVLQSSNFDEDGMKFPADAAWAGYSSSDSVALPTPGVSYEDQFAVPAKRVFKGEGVRAEQLTIPGMRRPVFSAGSRSAVVWANDVRLDVIKDELGAKHTKAAKVTFNLPSGSYATVVLRLLGQ